MKGKIEQAWANRLKVLRAAVRLKYSIMADNELNERIEYERRKFEKAVQNRKLLPPLDPKQALVATVDE